MSKLAKFTINEILPRHKRVGGSIEDFIPPYIASALIELEEDGILFRKLTREFLEYRVKVCLEENVEISEAVATVIKSLMVKAIQHE